MTRADMEGRRSASQTHLKLESLENREAPGSWRGWDFFSTWDYWRDKWRDSWNNGCHRRVDNDRCDWQRTCKPQVETPCRERPTYNHCTPKPPVCQPPSTPANSQVGGFVYYDQNLDAVYTDGETFFANVPMHLTGTSSTGATINRDTTTAADGTYNFGNLPAGNYSISVVETPDGYVPGHTNLGNFGGTPGVNTVTGVNVPASQSSAGYNFGMELFRPD